MGVKNIIGELQVNGSRVLTEKFSKGLVYNLSDDGTYYICSGIGTCTDTEVKIPTEYNGLPVREIGDYAFCGERHDIYTGEIYSQAVNPHNFVTKIIIPESVTRIGSHVFGVNDGQNDPSELPSTLEYVEMADSVLEVSESTFDCCISLKEIRLSQNLTNISNNMFMSCLALSNVIIPDSVTSIGDFAFRDCDSLTSVVIGDSVTYIGEYAFDGCYSLTSVVIPNSVTSICDYAFYPETIHLYCEATSQPEGWNVSWNANNCPVTWGFANDFVSVNEKLGDISTALDELHAQAQTIINGGIE